MDKDIKVKVQCKKTEPLFSPTTDTFTEIESCVLYVNDKEVGKVVRKVEYKDKEIIGGELSLIIKYYKDVDILGDFGSETELIKKILGKDLLGKEFVFRLE